MNYEKIQSDYIRRASSQKVFCKVLEGGIGILLYDGYSGYVIPDKHRYIDPSKFCSRKIEIQNLMTITDNDRELELTNHYIKSKNGYIVKATCEKFDVWINEKFIKPFTAPKKLYGCGEAERVLIINLLTGNPYGLIMPVRMPSESGRGAEGDGKCDGTNEQN